MVVMSLLDDLRDVAKVIDPSLQVNQNEVTGVLSALVAGTEQGLDNLLAAAEKGGAEEISKILAPAPPEPEPEPAPAPVEPAAPAEPKTADELRAEIDRLSAQLAAEQQTQVQHEPGAPADPPAEPGSQP